MSFSNSCCIFWLFPMKSNCQHMKKQWKYQMYLTKIFLAQSSSEMICTMAWLCAWVHYKVIFMPVVYSKLCPFFLWWKKLKSSPTSISSSCTLVRNAVLIFSQWIRTSFEILRLWSADGIKSFYDSRSSIDINSWLLHLYDLYAWAMLLLLNLTIIVESALVVAAGFFFFSFNSN